MKTSFVCAVTISAVVLLASTSAYAQQAGGPPGSMVFHSARDGHSNNQIYAMDPDGNNQVRITYDVAADVNPDISPNGQQIVFTSNQSGNNDIVVRDRAGATQNLTDSPTNDDWARWSPNGKQIVFHSNRDGGVFEIYLINADGTGDARRLTNSPAPSQYPSWSPDGKQIVFRRGIDIYAANADGTGTFTQLTNEVAPSFAQMAAFSPNGRYIAFMSLREGYCSVFRMNADGSDQVNLTPIEPGASPSTWCSRAPAWSADGQAVFFMSSRVGGQNQIFVMNIDGSNVRQLTYTGVNGSPRAR